MQITKPKRGEDRLSYRMKKEDECDTDQNSVRSPLQKQDGSPQSHQQSDESSYWPPNTQEEEVEKKKGRRLPASDQLEKKGNRDQWAEIKAPRSKEKWAEIKAP